MKHIISFLNESNRLFCVNNHLIFSSEELFDDNAVGEDEYFGDGREQLTCSSHHHSLLTNTLPPHHRISSRGIITGSGVQLDIGQSLNT